MKVNEFSKLIGIADSKIRYYDRKGLISSERRQNNYRDYSITDVLDIYHAQMLRSFDMSVDDSLKAIGQEFEMIDCHMEKTIEKLEKEINRKQKLLLRLKDIKKHFEFFQREVNMISYHHRPACYNLCHIGKETENDNDISEAVEMLVSVMPFSYIAIKVKKESIYEKRDVLDVRIGLGIIEENRELLNIELPEWVDKTQEGKVIYLYLTIKDPFEITRKDIMPLLEELEHLGIEIKDDIYGRIHMSYTENNAFVHGVVLAYRVPD